ncbi:MAG TPA: diacylglycerol kinase family protein [Armatimonadota bacterium]|jgi:diacylglycerol kinase family enzyme
MSLLLIMNPGSRAGRGQRRWAGWEAMLRRAGVAYRCVYTEHAGHAVALARQASGVETVVAVGGDGTINGVLDGLMQAQRPDVKMGVLYAGTSPDFCRFHGIPSDPERAMTALLAGAMRRVDVARISYRDAEGRECVAHFGCSCNIGLGATTARLANRWRRYLGDVPGTAAALLRALWADQRVDLELVVDGEPLPLPQVNNLSVIKNPYLASGLRLQVDIAPNDGALYLVAISGRSRLGMCRAIPACYSGAVVQAPGVLVRPCRAVQVRARQAQEIEFDGDPRGVLPVTIEVLPQALVLLGGADERV